MSYSNWCFTLNLPHPPLDETQPYEVTLLELDVPNVRYSIYSEEIGLSGNHHFQGYIQLYKKQRLSWLKRLIPGAHFEVQRAGDNKMARDYCAKTTDPTFISGPYETGSFTTQGARNDLIAVKAKLQEGVPMLDIANDHFGSWVRYHKSFTLYSSMLRPPRTTFNSLTLIYGSTGLGKTHLVRQMHPNAYWLTRPNNTAFYFEDYTGQTTLVIDEFYGWLPYDFMLRLCDKYPLKLPYRGGAYECQVTDVIITTNRRPKGFYKFDIQALLRRITLYTYFTAYKTYANYGNYDEFINDVLDFEFVQ